LFAVPSGQGPCGPCVPPRWPQQPRQALLREPASALCHGDARRRPRQAAGGYKLGHTMTQGAQLRSACPSHGDTHHLASPWPHWLTSSALRGQRQRLGRFLRAPFSCFSKSFHVRMTLRGAGGI